MPVLIVVESPQRAVSHHRHVQEHRPVALRAALAPPQLSSSCSTETGATEHWLPPRQGPPPPYLKVTTPTPGPHTAGGPLGLSPAWARRGGGLGGPPWGSFCNAERISPASQKAWARVEAGAGGCLPRHWVGQGKRPPRGSLLAFLGRPSRFLCWCDGHTRGFCFVCQNISKARPDQAPATGHAQEPARREVQCSPAGPFKSLQP